MPSNSPDVTRRGFLQVAAAAGAAVRTAPRVAITLDDVNWRAIPQPYDGEIIRRHLNGVKAALFVAGTNVDNDRGRAILKNWSDDGHVLGNHTYKHRGWHQPSIDRAEFEADVDRCEAIVKPYAQFRKLFRFPMLKEGKTIANRDAMRAALKQRGYRNGYVTIDASDWYYDVRLREKLAKEPRFDVQRYREPYLNHIAERSAAYEDLGRKLLDRGIPHTLLLHYNLINTLFLGDVLAQFRKDGWQVIDAQKAFEDPIFQREPNIAPAGESLLWAIATETGRHLDKLRYPGESDEYEKPLLDRLNL
jgi:peptidoglycan/xylan/chitin deacetylase (PgdA/CDA1 family)